MRTLSDSAVMVVHGPELFDQGDVAWLMDVLSPRRIVVAGVMARTAAEESGLRVEFNAQPPSRVIRALDDPVFLANRGKTKKTGELFGNIVASRLGDNGLVHIECSSRTVYCWNSGDEDLAGILSRLTGFGKKSLKSTVHRQRNVREIRGCIPGEAVYVNGIVIGRATEDVVVLRSRGGMVEPCSGLEPKPHGLEKLSFEPKHRYQYRVVQERANPVSSTAHERESTWQRACSRDRSLWTRDLREDAGGLLRGACDWG